MRAEARLNPDLWGGRYTRTRDFVARTYKRALATASLAYTRARDKKKFFLKVPSPFSVFARFVRVVLVAEAYVSVRGLLRFTWTFVWT